MMKHKVMYLLLVIALAAVSNKLAMQYNVAAEPSVEAFWQTVQPVTADEARAQVKAMRDLADHPQGGAITYFSDILARRDALNLRIQRTFRDRFSATQDPCWASLQNIQEQAACMAGPGCFVETAMENYQKKYSTAAWHAASVVFNQASPGGRYDKPGPMYPSGAPYWMRWYSITLFLALMFFFVRLDEKGLKLWVEVLQPQLYLAIAGWPAFIWFYPKHTPTQQIVVAMRFAAFFLGTALSGGMAMAAPKAKDGSKRDRKGKLSLQLDARVSRTLTSDPKPAGFLRATFTDRHGNIAEALNVVKQGYYWNWSVLGTPLPKVGPFAPLMVVGMANDSSGTRTLVGGLEVFGGGKRWGVAIGSMEVNRTIAPKLSTALASGGWVFVKPSARTSMGIRYGLTKILGKPPTWSMGLFGGYSWGSRGDRVESSIAGNGVGRLEGRLVHSFAF